MRANAGQGSSPVNGGQILTLEEQIVRNFLHSLFQRNRLQTATAFEDAAPVAGLHFLQSLGDRDLRQTDATIERTPGNPFQAGRKLHIGQGRTA